MTCSKTTCPTQSRSGAPRMGRRDRRAGRPRPGAVVVPEQAAILASHADLNAGSAYYFSPSTTSPRTPTTGSEPASGGSGPADSGRLLRRRRRRGRRRIMVTGTLTTAANSATIGHWHTRGSGHMPASSPAAKRGSGRDTRKPPGGAERHCRRPKPITGESAACGGTNQPVDTRAYSAGRSLVTDEPAAWITLSSRWMGVPRPWLCFWPRPLVGRF